jgi:transposase
MLGSVELPIAPYRSFLVECGSLFTQILLLPQNRLQSEKSRFENLCYTEPIATAQEQNQVKIDSIDIEATIEKAQRLISEDKQLSLASKSMFEIMILIITLLANRLNLDSSNSSKPPSSDPNRKKQRKPKTGNKTGGQKGHVGSTLKKVDDPDRVKVLEIDRRTLPPGNYRQLGFDTRQVFDIDISRVVTEYRAQILEDDNGCRFVASFPKDVTKAAQYGTGLKAHSVYMSQYQLVPYNRIQDHFSDQLHIPISEGSIFNFNQEAYRLLGGFEGWVKNQLAASDFAHADETGINIGGKGHWLHCLSNDDWTLYHADEKRGKDAMDAMGVLPRFNGILCHDHWKPYYRYDCDHALCNAHHIRELTRAWEQDGQQWAEKLKDLLETINRQVADSGGVLDALESQKYRHKYRSIIKLGEIECPEPIRPKKKGKRGRIKRSKSRNLLERLRDFENDTLRFMDNEIVSFTNNLGENDIRMTKVQQKISGCFRSINGARIFCRVRSYLSTCRKQGVTSSQALNLLFSGLLPEFLKQR